VDTDILDYPEGEGSDACCWPEAHECQSEEEDFSVYLSRRIGIVTLKVLALADGVAMWRIQNSLYQDLNLSKMGPLAFDRGAEEGDSENMWCVLDDGPVALQYVSRQYGHHGQDCGVPSYTRDQAAV
jgi:hypothetical protein